MVPPPGTHAAFLNCFGPCTIGLRGIVPFGISIVSKVYGSDKSSGILIMSPPAEHGFITTPA